MENILKKFLGKNFQKKIWKKECWGNHFGKQIYEIFGEKNQKNFGKSIFRKENSKKFGQKKFFEKVFFWNFQTMVSVF